MKTFNSRGQFANSWVVSFCTPANNNGIELGHITRISSLLKQHSVVCFQRRVLVYYKYISVIYENRPGTQVPREVSISGYLLKNEGCASQCVVVHSSVTDVCVKIASSLLPFFFFALISMPEHEFSDFRHAHCERHYSCGFRLKATVRGLWQPWVQTPGLPLRSCVALGQLTHLSVLQSFHLQTPQRLVWERCEKNHTIFKCI